MRKGERWEKMKEKQKEREKRREGVSEAQREESKVQRLGPVYLLQTGRVELRLIDDLYSHLQRQQSPL